MGIYHKSELTECELTAMKIVWDAKQPVTCQYVIEQLENKYGLSYKDTTVYTFMKNLKDKGFVKSYRKGITYYEATRDEQEYRDATLKKAENFWFDGHATDFVSALVNGQHISQDELDEIKKMIEEL